MTDHILTTRRKDVEDLEAGKEEYVSEGVECWIWGVDNSRSYEGLV